MKNKILIVLSLFVNFVFAAEGVEVASEKCKVVVGGNVGECKTVILKDAITVYDVLKICGGHKPRKGGDKKNYIYKIYKRGKKDPGKLEYVRRGRAIDVKFDKDLEGVVAIYVFTLPDGNTKLNPRKK